jgi:hypothetical protein
MVICGDSGSRVADVTATTPGNAAIVSSARSLSAVARGWSYPIIFKLKESDESGVGS